MPTVADEAAAMPAVPTPTATSTRGRSRSSVEEASKRPVAEEPKLSPPVAATQLVVPTAVRPRGATLSVGGRQRDPALPQQPLASSFRQSAEDALPAEALRDLRDQWKNKQPRPDVDEPVPDLSRPATGATAAAAASSFGTASSSSGSSSPTPSPAPLLERRASEDALVVMATQLGQATTALRKLDARVRFLEVAFLVLALAALAAAIVWG